MLLTPRPHWSSPTSRVFRMTSAGTFTDPSFRMLMVLGVFISKPNRESRFCMLVYLKITKHAISVTFSLLRQKSVKNHVKENSLFQFQVSAPYGKEDMVAGAGHIQHGEEAESDEHWCLANSFLFM